MNTHLKAARVFAKLMDNQFSFLGIGFGIDGIIGLVPGFGDVLGMLLSCYLLWIGYEMKLPANQIAKMVGNILVDTFVGSVPFVGDIADVLFKANIRNLQILEEFADEKHNGQTVVDAEVVDE